MTPTPIRRWLRMHRSVLPLGRFGEIVFDDSTGGLQMACGLFGLLSGWAMLTTPSLAPEHTQDVVFHFATPDMWGVARVALGLTQMVVATFPREDWQPKYVIAALQLALVTYLVAAWGLTVGPGFAPGQLWFLLMEVWIAARTLYDRDMNGTDRRRGSPDDQ